MGPMALFTHSGGGCGAAFRIASGGRPLPPGMINGVILIAGAFEDQLRNRHDRISLLDQVFENSRQGFRRVLCRVVEEDNGPRMDLGSDPLSDLLRRKAFPVQTIIIGIIWSISYPKSNRYFHSISMWSGNSRMREISSSAMRFLPTMSRWSHVVSMS